MQIMMTRPAARAVALDDSPRCGTCHRIHCHCAQPWARRTTASSVEEIEREDNQRWLEPHDDEVFHQLVAYLVADGDRRAVADMAARACPSCAGAGGRTEDTSSDGIVRRTWRSCTACGGTGQSYAPSTVARRSLSALDQLLTAGQCWLCGRWNCKGHDCPPAAPPTAALLPAAAPTGAAGQWFDDWPGGVCDGCR
ncbi:hypothetical protein AB0G74_16745 [Streptomyces sp. NPDC020875]|uniref:hypothetical protein n=1 Tax=Streptomyces sp. NPDC020875 TaxID=3154898 RepID=UPI0033E82843